MAIDKQDTGIGVERGRRTARRGRRARRPVARRPRDEVFVAGAAALRLMLVGMLKLQAEAIEEVLHRRRGRHRQFTGAGGRQRR